MADGDELRPRSFHLSGRDVSKIPCFRNSFLYGMGGGTLAGLTCFMFTSRGKFSMNVGYASFVATTLSYWFTCRYNYAQNKFAVSQILDAAKLQSIYQGTSLDAEENQYADIQDDIK